jgi:hypothetical protein
VLKEWLGETPIDAFRASHLGRMPLARPSAASDAVRFFDWDTLDPLLRHPDLDVLTIRGGREDPAPRPRGLEEARRLLAGGVGLVVRRAERHDQGLAALGRRLTQDLPGRFHVQLFVTAAGTHGFSWHYDAEEVFIVQTRGEKDYFFRRNTLDPEPVPGAQPDFARVREESTPIMTATLLPGDWLYLPRGWWHVAKARTDSLSISLGVTPEPRPGANRR